MLSQFKINTHMQRIAPILHVYMSAVDLLDSIARVRHQLILICALQYKYIDGM